MQIHRYLAVAGVAALAVTAGVVVGADAGARDGGQTFATALSGAQEVDGTGAASNPHGDADRGSAVITLNQGQGRVCWQFGAITLTAGEALPHMAHIHRGEAGVAGPIVVNLFGTAGTPAPPTAYPTDTQCVSAPKALVKEIRKNPDGFYVNLHNAQHPSGVMRGQLSG